MVAMDRLDEVLPRMEYIFVSLPSTPETRGLFNRRRLSSLVFVTIHHACYAIDRIAIKAVSNDFPWRTILFNVTFQDRI